MLLTTQDIKTAYNSGDIVIEPFFEENLNTNSYDVRLGGTISVYRGLAEGYYDTYGRLRFKANANAVFDPAYNHKLRHYTIPKTGVILDSGILYLGVTEEIVGSIKYVPRLDGKSSTGRAGISIHETAGVGDLGFINRWTLELTSSHSVLLRKGQLIGQFTFEAVTSIPDKLYSDVSMSNYNDVPDKPVKCRLFQNPNFIKTYDDSIGG